MICVSIGDNQKGFPYLKQQLVDNSFELVELRLDLLELSLPQVRKIFSLPLHYPRIATYRPGKIDEGEREKILQTAIENGAATVDIELETAAAIKNNLVTVARNQGCQVIISFHNTDQTPSQQKLEAILDQCFDSGADIAKIACYVQAPADNARLLSLYARLLPPLHADKVKPITPVKRQLIAIGMGEKGKITRVAAPWLGAPFTYAAATGSKETAPGQLDHQALKKIHYWIGS